MKQDECKRCQFNNPTPSVTAIIVKDGLFLVVKRNEEPFKNEWDFVGGYMDGNELPEETVKREIKEELDADCDLQYINAFSGTSVFEGKEFPVINFAYLVNLKGNITLNQENSAYEWRPLKEIKDIAFDSNKKILNHLHKVFDVNKEDVVKLLSQLDPSAQVDMDNYYRAVLDGYVSKIYDQDKLIGMGWIFPRRTLLRKQAVVEDMIVDQSYRGKHLGEKLLLDLLNWAKNEGVEVVELTTNSTRLAANGLYQKVGFKLHPTNHYLLKL